jgi:hypothetical protein
MANCEVGETGPRKREASGWHTTREAGGTGVPPALIASPLVGDRQEPEATVITADPGHFSEEAVLRAVRGGLGCAAQPPGQPETTRWGTGENSTWLRGRWHSRRGSPSRKCGLHWPASWNERSCRQAWTSGPLSRDGRAGESLAATGLGLAENLICSGQSWYSRRWPPVRPAG